MDTKFKLLILFPNLQRHEQEITIDLDRVPEYIHKLYLKISGKGMMTNYFGILQDSICYVYPRARAGITRRCTDLGSTKFWQHGQEYIQQIFEHIRNYAQKLHDLEMEYWG